ncbi:hypothetical protein X798_00805 [Onchocerca flexuosa]|uniref:Homeobox protein homothorax n=1 Tax=Onchocerca flexuosa TaxID=387005 RepID=A0A238C490_9BILA|nr:hypothetical protein X798_00805 [Onchocerca flexuosa]
MAQGYHASVHDLSNASSSSAAAAAAAAAAAQQHPSTTPDSHPLVLGGVTPLTAGGTQTSISLTAVSSPSGSSSAGGQRLDSTPHSVETPNQLLTAQQQDNVSDTGSKNSDSYPSSISLSCHFGEHQQLSNGTANDYCTDSMPKQRQQGNRQNQNCRNIIIPTDHRDIATTPTTTSPVLMMSLTKKRGIFPKPATNIMRAWLFHHLTGRSHVVFPGDESLSMCGSLNDDGGRESVLSEGNTGSGGGSGTGANKRKVPKV